MANISREQCWINESYPDLRLYTHYIFIFICEFGVIVIYTLLYSILIRRATLLRLSKDSTSVHTTSSSEAQRTLTAAKLMVLYPLVYVLCTLPLASARMASMAGKSVPLGVLCMAGAMITSNGWLDALLYVSTRKVMIFSDAPPPEDAGIDTFASPFWGAESRFGTTTTISAVARKRSSAGGRQGLSRLGSGPHSRQGSMDELVEYEISAEGVMKNTVVQIRSEPMELQDIVEAKEIRRKQKGGDLGSSGYDDSKSGSSLQFKTGDGKGEF